MREVKVVLSRSNSRISIIGKAKGIWNKEQLSAFTEFTMRIVGKM